MAFDGVAAAALHRSLHNRAFDANVAIVETSTPDRSIRPFFRSEGERSALPKVENICTSKNIGVDLITPCDVYNMRSI